jgi:hypothetical protein
MATENPTWGYTRIQGAWKNLGHRVARSTVATILRQQGIPPRDERPTSWQTFLRAHWCAFVAADFFTTEVWTVRGLVTYYTVFVIELHSRRVHLLGSTPHPDEAFMLQIARHLTDAADGVLDGPRFLICDRDRKWSAAVRQLLETSGAHVIRTPCRAPNCNAHAERFCGRHRAAQATKGSVGDVRFVWRRLATPLRLVMRKANTIEDAGGTLAALALGTMRPPDGRVYGALRRGKLTWPTLSELAVTTTS